MQISEDANERINLLLNETMKLIRDKVAKVSDFVPDNEDTFRFKIAFLALIAEQIVAIIVASSQEDNKIDFLESLMKSMQRHVLNILVELNINSVEDDDE